MTKTSNILSLALLLIFIFSCQQNTPTEEETPPNKAFEEISFTTSDSIEIMGDLYVINKQAPTALLFHQAGSNAKGEYGPIIPALQEKGWNVLAIDQRSGGQRFGQYNRTIVSFTNRSFSFCEAYPDLEGALDYLIESGFTGAKIAWGSSYSAALAVQLGSRRKNDLAGVLAFSPASGGPMQACKPDDYFENFEIPLLLLRPSREMELESVQNQFNLAKEHNHQTYVAQNGTHGSSMLVEERVKNSVEENWNAVFSFLDQVK